MAESFNQGPLKPGSKRELFALAKRGTQKAKEEDGGEEEEKRGE